MRRPGAAACLLLAAGCGRGDRPPAPSTAALPPGVIAKAGSELVATASVARLFEARGLTAHGAAGISVSDALWAQAARANLPPSIAHAVERAALARSMLLSLSRAAEAAGPPSDAETSQLVDERWLELARPPAARTTHVVVINDKPERDAQAHGLADKLALALRDAKTHEEFLRIANAFPKQGFDVRAEELSFVTGDGRTFQRYGERFVALGDKFDLDFARAANALQTPGQQSPVTKSQFGYHVIWLDERDAGRAPAKNEVSTLIAPEIMARRAAQARRELVERLRGQSSIQLERAVDELTASVKASP